MFYGLAGRAGIRAGGSQSARPGHGQRQRAAFFSRNAETPVMVIAVGSGDRIGRVLSEVGGLLRHPLLTLERVSICKRDGITLGDVSRVQSGTDATGTPPQQKLMACTSEAAQYRGLVTAETVSEVSAGRYHRDDCHQRDQHVQQVSVQAARLKSPGRRHHLGEQPYRWPVQHAFHDPADV